MKNGLLCILNLSEYIVEMYNNADGGDEGCLGNFSAKIYPEGRVGR